MKAATFFSCSSSPLVDPSNLITRYSPSPFSPLFLNKYSNNHTNTNVSSNNKTFVKAIHTASISSSYNPEDARVPPALPLPTPSLTKFKIALCQLPVTVDKDRNIGHARKSIEEAAQKGAQLVLLPEIWNTPYSNDNFPGYAEDIDASGDASPSTAMLSEVSRRHQITIIHLFDIDIPGQITFKESDILTAGDTPTIVDTDVGRIGIGIWYDIRFQELATLYAARGAHLLCYPGAFNMTTGPLHWELLRRARGADCQFGEVLATTEHDEAIVIAEIDYSLIPLRRQYLPFEKQRRADLYQLVDVQRLNSAKKN